MGLPIKPKYSLKVENYEQKRLFAEETRIQLAKRGQRKCGTEKQMTNYVMGELRTAWESEECREECK